jgi:ABC-type lipoprotein export system ATPase subunit
MRVRTARAADTCRQLQGDRVARPSDTGGVQSQDGHHGPLIEARGVCRSFDNGRIHALRGVDATIDAGEMVVITGPSGSGKSTLLHLIGTLDRPTSGDILFQGRSLGGSREQTAFRSRTVGFIFQSFNLLPTLSALDNVQVPMFEMGWTAARRRRRAGELLERVGLAGHQHQRPAQLSGGERQRVAIARSLANAPTLLLADEPTGNLDSANALATMALLESLQREQHMTLLIVTHSPEIASRAGRAIHLLDGRVVADTTSSAATLG